MIINQKATDFYAAYVKPPVTCWVIEEKGVMDTIFLFNQQVFVIFSSDKCARAHTVPGAHFVDLRGCVCTHVSRLVSSGV